MYNYLLAHTESATCRQQSVSTNPLHTAGPVPPHTMPCADPKTRALYEPRVPEPLARQTPRYTYRCAVTSDKAGARMAAGRAHLPGGYGMGAKDDIMRDE